MRNGPSDTPTLLKRALQLADETRAVEIGPGKLAAVGRMFLSLFGRRQAVVVADGNTWQAAAEATIAALEGAGIEMLPPVLFETAGLRGTDELADRLASELSRGDGVPVAVGSGTINDLTKLASHRSGRRYLIVATAASMDGYAAFGASLTAGGAKRTLACPAPLGIVVDTTVLAGAPVELNAAGYADLLAKVVSGADWILADALGIEAIDPIAWELSQPGLRDWVSNPRGVRLGYPAAIGVLAEGLLMTGFAMQAAKSSRPASGAEHQFSHLWDMEHGADQKKRNLHGQQVGIGTLLCASLYESLLDNDFMSLDVRRAIRQWPSWEAVERRIDALFTSETLRETARREARAKFTAPDALAERLERLRRIWPELLERLRGQLLSATTLRALLREAGAPSEPEQIGLDAAGVRRAFEAARLIRRRYTVLDLAAETGYLEIAVSAHGTRRKTAGRGRV